MELYVKKFFFPYLIFFWFLNMILSMTYIAASNTASDDITN